MAKDNQLHIRLTEEEKKRIEKDAQSQSRSVSNFLIWLWSEWSKKNKK